ncbi:phosphotransferase enzyme family protein [Methylomicrobium lacus]|uniref:phosphotransferase enzyme family protein n=1 Tax=Methylomicrobium lacus TaxID=136992 RepID=UPI0035A90DDC
MIELLAIARQFSGSSTAVLPLGNGLINATYLVTTAAEPFVLQCINAHVFPEPEAILTNLAEIGRHIDSKAPEAVELQIPRLIQSEAGFDSVCDDRGRIWRATRYIADTVSLEVLGNLHEARQAGFALGHFHRLLSDLDPVRLKDTLPGFHITPAYLANYDRIQPTADPNRISKDCSSFIERHRVFADDLETAKRQGLLPLRIIHGDPKLNNFLFDRDRQKAVGLIDLDTVKPGLLHYDIGDCLRSCCHRPENDTFDPDIGEAILASYLDEAGHFFTGPDYDYLYAAIRLIPFELGLRFYTDHLEGDRYFKVEGPEQNLERALGQFRLCKSIIAQEGAIIKLVESLLGKTA